MGHPSKTKGKSERVDWLVARTGHMGEECLPWPFSRARGYGNLKYGDKITYAHTVMCELVHGPAPSPIHQAAHSCGKGAEGCVNPRHISWKTPSENQLDKRVHGGVYRGGRSPRVTPQDVLTIRALAGKETHDAIARRFNISRRNVGAIIDRRSWKRLTAVGQLGADHADRTRDR